MLEVFIQAFMPYNDLKQGHMSCFSEDTEDLLDPLGQLTLASYNTKDQRYCTLVSITFAKLH